MKQQSTSLWEETSSAPQFEALSGDLDADIAIIGAGITGLTAALLLRERGRNVVVLEKGTVGGGETGNTTAHLTVAIDARYHYVQRKFGKEEARMVADASKASLETIAELVQRHSIDCQFRRLPGYLYTEKRKYVAELKNEAAAARESGIDAQYTDSVPLPFQVRGGVVFANQAQFHPRKYIAGLAERAAAAGCRIFERTLVTSVKGGEPCVLETERGQVKARAVFMATNVPIAGFTTVHTLTAAYRTYALAFQVDGEHPDGLFWDTADPYHYTRWQESDAGTFLIVGGEDHRTGEDEDTEGCFERLLEYSGDHFGVHPLKHRWSGQVIEPHGGLPLIGGDENVYVSTGYAGQGLTFGTLGAMIVTDQITGVANPWSELFDVKRKRPHMTAREFLTENLHVPKHIVTDRLASFDVEGRSLDEVHEGEGKIVKVEGQKIAAYRDDEGRLFCVSPVCTHMKCDVAWNGAERTWDCPCHGSRFTPEGEVLNGPATDPLEKIEV